MATLTIRYDVDVNLGGEVKRLRSPATPATLDITELYDPTISIPSGDTAIVWDPKLSGVPVSVTAFKYLAFLSDSDTVDVELTTNEADANEELASFRLKANVLTQFGDDTSFSNHAASDVFAGDLNAIDKIRIQNNGTSAALVRVWIAN